MRNLSAKQSPDSHCFTILQATRRHSPALYVFAPGAAHSNRVTPIRNYCTLQAERQVKHPGKVKNPEIIKKESTTGAANKEEKRPCLHCVISAPALVLNRLVIWSSRRSPCYCCCRHYTRNYQVLCAVFQLSFSYSPTNLAIRFFVLGSRLRVTCYFTINEERKGYAPNLSFRLTTIIQWRRKLSNSIV